MPVIKQKMIYREDLRANPDRIYLFGDNSIRIGNGGQAGAMRGEPNALGIATKWTPSMDDRAFFSDSRYEDARDLIEADLVPVIEALKAGKTVVIPEDGLGTGLSQLPSRAPAVNLYLTKRLEYLETI